MADLFLHLGNMLPVGSEDLNADHLNPKMKVGALSFQVDDYGFRIFEYCRNMSGSAVAQGELQKRIADVVETNVTSGTTTSVTKSGWTAGDFVGRILYVDDNDDSAGAAPEGESSPIVANSATIIQVDPGRPFSVAIAASDDVRIVSWNHLDDAADSDLASKVKGVAVGKNGVSSKYYGWWQRYGICPDVIHSAATVTSLNPVVAGAHCVAAHGSDAVDLWVGTQIGTHTSDVVSLKSPVDLLLFGFVRPIA